MDIFLILNRNDLTMNTERKTMVQFQSDLVKASLLNCLEELS